MIKKVLALFLIKYRSWEIFFIKLYRAQKSPAQFACKESYFTSLGFKYLGPIDGHNEALIEELLERAKQFKSLSYCI